MLKANMEVGDKVYLSRDAIEDATGDHPAFLMGECRDEVEIVEINPWRDREDGYIYLVNNLKDNYNPFYVRRDELMWNKLFIGN